MEENKAKIIVSAEDQLTGTLNKAGRELDGFGGKIESIGSKLESAGLRIGAMGLAANAGLAKLGLDLGTITQKSIDAEKALFGIASTAGINGAAAEAIAGKWSVALDQIAKDSNQTTGELITAFQDLVSKGISEKDALGMLAPIGRAATATSANIRDLAVAASASFSKLEIPVASLGKALDMMAAAGDAGAFELKDMAQYFDMLTAKSADLGSKGPGALGQLAAAAQIARRGTGDAASAATNLANFLDKLNASTTYNQFEKIGLDLGQIKKEALASGDFIGGMITKIRDITGGDAAKISALFPDVQAGGFARQAVRDLELYRDIALKAAEATGTVGEKLDTQLRTSAEKIKGAEINLSVAISSSSVIKNLLDALEGLADWSAKHPDIAAMIGIGVATTAAVGLVGGAVIAGIGATITAVSALSGALSGMSALLLANPVIAALLGVAAVGVAVYTYWDDITAAFSAFDKKFLAGMASIDASLKKFQDGVSNYFSGIVETWKNAGAGLIDALRAGITERLQGALGIGEKISQAITYLKGEAGKWAQIGGNLMQGLLDGIFAKYTEIINRIKSLGSDMIKTVKNVLGIQSPSKEFYKIGIQTGEGLENGLLATEQSVADAAGKLGTSSIDVVKESLSQLKIEGASLTSSMRTEQEKLNDTLERYKYLLDEKVISLETYQRAVVATNKSVAALNENVSKGLRDGKGRFLPEDEAARALAVWQNTSNDISKSLTDALLRGFESGKGFAQNLRDTFKNMFNTLVLRPIIQPFAQGGGNFIASLLGLGGSGSALAGGSSVADAASGGGQDLLSLASTLKSGYQAVSSFFSGGAAAAPNYYAATAPAAASAGATPALSSAATYLGSAAAGFVIGKMISGGYSAFGKSGNAAVIAGTALGALGGPVGMIIGGALGGVVNRLFGRKLTETGIQGSFGGQGFSGQNYTFEKGGFFRSDKERTSPLDAAMDESLDKSYQQLRSSALLLGNVFKDTSKTLDDFSYSIKLNFLGLNADQSKALLEGELKNMGEAMSTQILNDVARAELAAAGITDSLAADVEKYWQELARGGESATETLTRLSGSLAGVNGWLDKMGLELYATTLAAGDMASELVDLFEGMDKFSASVQKYISIYYSAAERFVIGTEEITATFDAFGLKLPGTLEEFRALVTAQDLTTESGRNAWHMLMDNSEAFAALYQSSGQAAIGGRTLMKAWEDQNAALAGLINTFDGSALAEANLSNVARSRYQVELALIKQIESALQSTHQMFTSTIDEMKFSVLDNEGKYNFLADKSKSLEALFSAATDPAEIQSLANQLNQVSRDAWMLLGDAEKKIKLSEYEKYLNELDAMTTTRLQLVKTKIKDEGGDYKTANDAIAAAVAAGIAAGMERAAAGFDKAASAMQAAADTPVKVEQTVNVNVDVDMPANVEVGIA